MEWLYSILKGTGFSYTIRDVILDERFMPGAWSDIGVLMWQERLIGAQLKSQKKKEG